jgi:Spy/CpxP family protein refolding chaperone
MKNLIVITLLSLTISGFAQEQKNNNRAKRPVLSVDQRTELQVKKLTLELDLTAEQQKEITKIIDNQQNKREVARENILKQREVNKKKRAEKRFAAQSTVLDARIAHRNELKKVLTAEQLKKWDTMSKSSYKSAKKGMKRKARSEE